MCRPIECQVLPSALLPLKVNISKEPFEMITTTALRSYPVPPTHGISLQDEAFQHQAHANLQNLIITAASPKSSAINALLAKKALRYRKKIPTSSKQIRMSSMHLASTMEVSVMSC